LKVRVAVRGIAPRPVEVAPGPIGSLPDRPEALRPAQAIRSDCPGSLPSPALR